MYDELVKSLRELCEMTALCEDYSCFECPYEEKCSSYKNGRLSSVYGQAADAINEMNRRIDQAIELYNRNIEKTAMYEVLVGISPEPPKEDKP